MVKNIKRKNKEITVMTPIFITNYVSKINAATSSSEDEVNIITSRGIKIFFGALLDF